MKAIATPRNMYRDDPARAAVAAREADQGLGPLLVLALFAAGLLCFLLTNS